MTEIVGPGRGNWLAAPSLPAGRAALAAASLNGKIYAVGGIRPDGWSGLLPLEALTAELTAYNPATGIWTTRAPMPAPRGDVAATVAGGQLYAIGGANALPAWNPVATVQRYDPIADAWTTVAPLTVARGRLAAATVNGIIYAVGGRGASADVAALDASDPATDTWMSRAPRPTAGQVAAGAINGVLYTVGGIEGRGHGAARLRPGVGHVDDEGDAAGAAGCRLRRRRGRNPVRHRDERLVRRGVDLRLQSRAGRVECQDQS